MTDEATPGETESGEPETPATADTPETAADATAEPAAAESDATSAEPEAAVPAVRDESAVPAVASATGPTVDPRQEARLTRLILPFALPIGAILVVAFYTFNLSRVFIATSEGDSTAAVILAAGITLAILGGATAIAAFPEIRTSSLVIGLSLVMLVVLMAGSIVLGTSEPESEASAAFVEPKGPAINTLEVDALPELSFQAKTFDVPGGVNQVKYIDKGGAHTLVFADNKVPGFQLAVPDGKSASKVELKPNSTYTIYCTVPGHRAAGMQAEIVVGAKGGAPEAGTETPGSTIGAGTTQTTLAPGSDPNNDPASQSSSGSDG